MSVKVVVWEDDRVVEEVDLDRHGYCVFTSDLFEIAGSQRYPTTGTVQLTIKPVKTDASA